MHSSPTVDEKMFKCAAQGGFAMIFVTVDYKTWWSWSE